MSKKISVASTHPVGCTFVDWSIHFLSGQTTYYHAESDQHVSLSQDPLTKLNAHNHNKNHPDGYDKIKSTVDQFNKLPDDVICSMYPRQLFLDVAAAQLNLSLSELSDPTTFKTVCRYINDDFNKMFDLFDQTQTKLIFIPLDTRVALYHQNIRVLERYMTSPGVPDSEQDIIDEQQELFFKNSIDHWKNLNLTNIWDVRERMALDIRPTHIVDDYGYNLVFEHLCINCQELWNRTEHTLTRIMKYLELDIIPERLQQWLPVCKKWQAKQLDLLDFPINQPHIVKAIVNNWYYKINLTFQQEVLIQHYLMYQHGLNLKTWNLSKFPSNTQDLHKLLEPNIHPVQKIY
jgi:hypothetical protein